MLRQTATYLWLMPFCVSPSTRIIRSLTGLALAAGLLAARPAAAQEALPNKVYTYAEQMPALPGGGGTAAIQAAIQKRLRYPARALANRVEGQVFVSFVVLADGSVSDAKVVKSLGTDCDEAALIAVRQLPRFVPGKIGGQAVAVSYLAIPVPFQVDNSGAAARAGTAPDTSQVVYRAMPMPQLPPGWRIRPNEPLTDPTGRTAPASIELAEAVQRLLVPPAEVTSSKVEGRVRVAFLVGASGVIRRAAITNHLSAATDTAALQAVRRLPRLVPGRVQDHPVAVLCAAEVLFFGPRHVYDYVAQGPVFPAPGLPAYLRQHLRVPPVVAAENLDGQVGASFVVGADGRVRDPAITTPMCASCDAEVLRFLKALPAYQPARLNGQPVAVRQNLQIRMPPNPVDKDSLTRVYTYVEQMPALPGEGSYGSIATAVQQRLVLPAEVKAGEVTGKNFVRFTVGPRGSIYDIKMEKTLSPACDAAALAAVRQLPRLEGGKQNGRGVAVSLTLPVVFTSPNAGK